MKSRTLTLMALACTALVLVIAGCGGDDETSSSTTSTTAALTETEFLAQGNAICIAANKELDQAANDTFTGGQPTDAQIEQYAGVLVPNVQGQVDAIRALTPPEDLVDQVDTFLADAEDALAQVSDDPSLLLTSDSNGPFSSISQEARQIGLDECAS
jgi:hypothetical protein